MNTPLPTDSLVMRVLRAIGLERLAWSLRRLHCPVDDQALVLEVGAGGNPFMRSNVLLDAYAETQERHWAPLVADRPFVFGKIERLPFRDKAFDFLIACHVVEHTSEPEKVLKEFQRVAKAGYIECPDAFMERLNPYHDHRLEVTVRNDRLMIRKKAQRLVDPELVELYEHRAKPFVTGHLIPRHPFAFHVRYFWHESFEFTILNPETDAGWRDDAPLPSGGYQPTLRERIRDSLVAFVRPRLSQTERNRNIDLISLLQCPACRSHGLKKGDTILSCPGCNAHYPLKQGIPVMFPPA